MYLEGNSEPKREDKCGIRPVNRAKLTNGSVTEFVEKMGYEYGRIIFSHYSFLTNSSTGFLMSTLFKDLNIFSLIRLYVYIKH